MQDVDSESRSRRIAPADEAEATGLAARIVLWFGAALSVALVAGVVFWAYNLGQRNASDVPVIRALEGLPRERPADPGGAQVAHQGFAVNEVLAGSESTEPAASAALAPEPGSLSADDQPSLPDIENQADVNPQAESGEVVPGAPGPLAPLPAAPDSPPQADEAPATALDIPRPLRRATAPAPSAQDSALAEAIANALAEAEGGAPAAPAPDATAGEAAPAPAPTPGSPPVPIGTQMIQLGAFDTEAAAIDNWTLLAAAHPQLFATMQRHVELRQAGGRVFYRLRGLGFADLEAARAMCAALLAREVQCITATARE